MGLPHAAALKLWDPLYNQPNEDEFVCDLKRLRATYTQKKKNYPITQDKGLQYLYTYKTINFTYKELYNFFLGGVGGVWDGGGGVCVWWEWRWWVCGVQILIEVQLEIEST